MLAFANLKPAMYAGVQRRTQSRGMHRHLHAVLVQCGCLLGLVSCQASNMRYFKRWIGVDSLAFHSCCVIGQIMIYSFHFSMRQRDSVSGEILLEYYARIKGALSLIKKHRDVNAYRMEFMEQQAFNVVLDLLSIMNWFC